MKTTPEDDACFALRRAARLYAARYLTDLCISGSLTPEEDELQRAALKYAAAIKKRKR